MGRQPGRPAARDGIVPHKVVLRGTVPEGEYFAAAAGDSPFPPGALLAPGTPLERPVPAWTFPFVPDERPIPFDYHVLHTDAELIVVDKPHFLPTTSNGRLVRETLQTRLRRDFDEDVTPLHRLDRLTAGVVVCSRNPATRGAYQRLFEARAVHKTYEAWLSRPLDIPGHMIDLPMRKVPGARQVLVDPAGTPTRTWVAARGHRAALRPETGHTHQLRVLLNHLGAPIVGDDTYPLDRGLDLYDFSRPLQLLAARVEFDDPLTGAARGFSTSLTLRSTLG